MLKVHAISSVAETTTYFEADDYYCSDKDGRGPSSWFGVGAAALGLAGEVDRSQFREVLDGRLADGTVLAGGRSGERRPGWDLTFSAPKSVSMQALIGDDTRLVDAHEAAVDGALAYFEKYIAAYREAEADGTVRKPAAGIIVAQFRHQLSRNVDPQMHTHCCLVNAVRRPDGEWRCLDATEMFRQQKLLGVLYRTELARQVINLGYSVRMEHSDGRFELSHITTEQVEAFSTRSRDLREALSEKGLDYETATVRQREVATLASRRAKEDVARDAVRQEWRERAEGLAVDFAPTSVHPAITGEHAVTIAEAMKFAIDHTTERKAVVERHELIAAALGRAGPVGGLAALPVIAEQIDRMVACGELVSDGSRYTSADALRVERDLLSIAAEGCNRVAPICVRLDFAELEASPLNPGQRQAARTILTTRDRLVCVNGWAGTGKTTLLASVRAVAETHSFKVIGVAPSAAAAHVLGAAGITAETVAAFLARQAMVDGGTLVVLDEAGMVGARDMRDVLRVIEDGGAHIVLVGDEGQLKSISAGAPFQQLQALKGITTERLRDIVRQKNPALGEAVTLAACRDVRRAVAKLRGQTAEIVDQNVRWASIAQAYARLSPSEQSRTLILSGTTVARDAINANVRRLLGREGGQTVPILRSLNLTQAERGATVSYTVGDVLEPTKTYKLSAVGPDGRDLPAPRIMWMPGEQASVVAIRDGRVDLEFASGARGRWQPSLYRNVSVFRRAELDLMPGDIVRVTQNDYKCGVRNGDILVVERFDALTNSLRLTGPDGAVVALDLTRALHVEHGYASTVYAAQGRTADRVLLDACTRSLCANEASFYVAISRAKHEAWIYTDDRQALPDAMSRPNDKIKALDLLSPQKRAELGLTA